MEVRNVLWKTMVGVGGVAIALVASGCASGSNSAGTSAGARNSVVTVSERNVAGVGAALVDGDGKTLYFADQESAENIYCIDACLQFWTPLTVASGGNPAAGNGVAGMLSTTSRPDGHTQVTYDGKPLYTFSLDGGAGQAKGNGFTDAFGGTQFKWHAAVVSGTASAPSSSDGIGYGY
jgi:predicted lipoprotein with Yx(FWY)xxD motif